jgi:hypothetical protein
MPDGVDVGSPARVGHQHADARPVFADHEKAQTTEFDPQLHRHVTLRSEKTTTSAHKINALRADLKDPRR